MARADYQHQLEEWEGQKVLIIEDLDLGGMTVTNDIESVISDIEKMEKIDAKDYLIVYLDNGFTWDGFDAKAGKFVSLDCMNWHDAVDSYLFKQERAKFETV